MPEKCEASVKATQAATAGFSLLGVLTRVFQAIKNHPELLGYIEELIAMFEAGETPVVTKASK